MKISKEVLEAGIKKILDEAGLEAAISELALNPEILSDQPTHVFNGIKVKVFTDTCPGTKYRTAEIMEGPDAGKWTTVVIADLVALNETETK